MKLFVCRPAMDKAGGGFPGDVCKADGLRVAPFLAAARLPFH